MKLLSNYTYYAIVKFNYNNFDGIQYMSHNKHFVFCEFKEKYEKKQKNLNNEVSYGIYELKMKEIKLPPVLQGKENKDE